jgi:hypothetical protein
MAHLPPEDWRIIENDTHASRLPTTFEKAGQKYYANQPRELYRLLAISNSIVPEPIEELLGAVSTSAEMRLIAAYKEGPLWNEEDLLRDARDKRARFRQLLHDDCRSEARRAIVHILRDEQKRCYTMIWPDIFLQEYYESSRYISSFLAPDAARPFEDSLYPCTTKRFQLPNTGSLRYVFSLRGDSDERVVLADREALFLSIMPYVDSDNSYRSTRDFMRIKLRNSGGLRLSDVFRKRHIPAMQRRDRLGMSSVNVDETDSAATLYDIMQKSIDQEKQYVAYKQTIIESMHECIDLSKNEPCWSPNGAPHVTMQLLQLLEDDMKKENRRGAKPFVFPRACNYLNQLVAKEPDPGKTLWMKVPYYSEGKRDGSELRQFTVDHFMKSSGITMRVPAPESADEVQRYLRKVKVDEKSLDYVWMEWFIRHGCREVLGTRFLPLRITQSVTDNDQVMFINLFQGFRCHEWIRNSFDECRTLFQNDALRKETPIFDAARSDMSVYEKGPLGFFLDHIVNLCGGSQESATIRHGWNALMCFYPDEKPPTFFLNQGPPGCGKSSTDEMLAKWMLNKAHVRKVTAIEHLVGHFNADSEKTVFTIIEEMDFKDAKSKAMAALQELVTCKELRGERKGVDASMRGDYNHFSCNTNAESPIILPRDQRRVMICVFSRITALKMSNDAQFKKDYLTRLAAVLDDEQMWKSYAYWLYETFCKTNEMAMEVLRSLRIRRVFNWSTTKTQLVSMIYYADTSVLGWMFMCIARYQPFTGQPAKAFVFQHDSGDTEFQNWNTWSKINARAISRDDLREDAACKKFKNHSWQDCKLEDTDNWWHKELRQNVYKRYCDALHAYASSKYHAVCLSEPDFFAELRRLLTTLDPLSRDDRVSLLEFSETATFKDELIAREWICFAPLRQLRERIALALPPAWNFSWEEYYKQTK